MPPLAGSRPFARPGSRRHANRTHANSSPSPSSLCLALTHSIRSFYRARVSLYSNSDIDLLAGVAGSRLRADARSRRRRLNAPHSRGSLGLTPSYLVGSHGPIPYPVIELKMTTRRRPRAVVLRLRQISSVPLSLGLRLLVSTRSEGHGIRVDVIELDEFIRLYSLLKPLRSRTRRVHWTVADALQDLGSRSGKVYVDCLARLVFPDLAFSPRVVSSRFSRLPATRTTATRIANDLVSRLSPLASIAHRLAIPSTRLSR